MRILGQNQGANTVYTFDDLLLVPQYSEIESRSDVSLKTRLKHYELDSPIIAANMDTVCGLDMARSLLMEGAVGVVHRYMSHQDQLGIMALLDQNRRQEELDDVPLAAAVGIKNGVVDHAQRLAAVGTNIIVVDVAHGHQKAVGDVLTQLKEANLVAKDGRPVELVAGNVATADGAMFLFIAGADTVKVGVGSGRVCTTRTVTGHGMPQLSAIVAVARILHKFDGYMIADGGIRNSGDIVKSLAAGASAVMVGSLFAGTHEAPGELFKESESWYKVYRGMASQEAQEEFFGNSPVAPEGVTVRVPYRGRASSVLNGLHGGMRSGFTYSGAKTIQELQSKALWSLISPSSILEAGTL